jgi:general secretion pathway protein L
MPAPSLPHWTPGAGPPPAGRYLALVPGEAAPLVPVALPAGLRGTARAQVARRQIADRLGPAAGALDLRPAALGPGPFAAMLAVEGDALARWRAAPGTAAAVALLPDYLALPAAPGLWVLAVEGGRVLARLGLADGFAAEPALAAILLTEARTRGPAPRAVWAPAPLPPEVAAALADLPRTDSPPPEARALAHGEAGLDLRRAAGSEAAQLAAGLRVLALAAALAGAGALAWAASVVIEAQALARRADAIAAETLATAQAALLPPGPVVDLRLQVLREIERRRGTGGGGLSLVRAAAEGLAQAGAVPQALALDGGALRVDLSVPGFAALEAVTAALAAQGLAVSVVRQVGGGAGAVEATLALVPSGVSR